MSIGARVPTSARLKSLRALMAKTKTDLVVLGPGPHMQYLLGFYPHPDERPCLLLVSKERETFLMPKLNAQGVRESTGITFHLWSDDEGPKAALAQSLQYLGAKDAVAVALDESMRADFALLVVDALPNAARCFTPETIGAMRVCKEDFEYDLLKENALINDNAMKTGWAALKPGMTELDVADAVRAHFPKESATPQFSIIGSGPNGAFPHHATGQRKLQTGDAVVMDIGGSKSGFYSDMTRMAAIGHAPEGYVEVHAIVEAAVVAALNAAKPGVKAKTVDAAARDVIKAAGYGDYFTHRLGHGLGIEVHEPPYITSVSETVLKAGMVFSIEPGIYLPGRFGVRLEEIVILREDGPEIFSSLPRALHVAT